MENPIAVLQRPNQIYLGRGQQGIYCCMPDCGSAFYNSKGEKTGIGFFYKVSKKLRLIFVYITGFGYFGLSVVETPYSLDLLVEDFFLWNFSQNL